MSKDFEAHQRLPGCEVEPLYMKAPANGISVLVAECTLALPAVLLPIDGRSGSQ